MDKISCGCCTNKDENRKDAFGHPHGCVCENHMNVPDGVLPGKCEKHVVADADYFSITGLFRGHHLVKK